MTQELDLNRNLKVDGQKWLIYPSCALVNLPLILVIVLWPIYAAAGLTDNVIWPNYRNHFSSWGEAWAISLCISTALCLWWLILGMILRIRPQIVRMIFRPFGNWFSQTTSS